MPPLHPLHRILLAALLGLVGVAGSSAAGPIERPPGCPERGMVSRTRDLSCYVAPRELARWRSEGELVIVDAREPAEFRRLRIPGSINLPLRSLVARDHLKTRKLLLVDRGYASDGLEAACRELRAAGFGSVGIVEGGLNAWAQTAGDLEGDRATRVALNRIPARELASAVRWDHWLVVDISEAGAPDLADGASRLVHVPLGADPAAFRSALADAIGAREAGPGALFLAVLEQDGSRHVEVVRALSSLGVVHAFFAEGGLDAYRSALAAQRSGPARIAGLDDPRCEAQ